MIETQTIDYSYVKKILDHCPNYDLIVNYIYKEGDTLTASLIDWYRELIFSASDQDERQLKIIKAVDAAVALYIKNNKYKRGLKGVLTVEEIQDDRSIREVIKKIIRYTNVFQEEEVLSIKNDKWL